MFDSVRLMLGCLAALCAPVASARADIIVVAPNNLEAVEGNGGNAFPFGATNLPTQRYQQVYSASEFSAFGGPAWITQIAFRPDSRGAVPFSYTIDDIQFNLSTTQAAPDGLSTTFADNVGADDMVVRSGSLLLSSAASGPAGGPFAFDIVITLDHPFLYDPSAGNLLLDVRRFSASPTTSFFDQQLATGDSISRVFTNGRFPDGVNSATGAADSRGLVTQFTAVTPEPASLTMLGLGSVALFAWGRRRSRSPLAPCET